VDGKVFNTSEEITIAAAASDDDGSISKIEFYNGGIKLGSVSSEPYSITWANPGVGTYSLTAVATDNFGMQSTSSAISISVTEVEVPGENQPPSVVISSPQKGKIFESSYDIEIEIVATDSDGSISKVELYNGSEKLAEFTTAPYLFTWKSVSDGIYKIKAIATDNLNATGISSEVQLMVGKKTTYDANSEIINLYPNPNDGHFTIDILVPFGNSRNQIVISDMTGHQVYREVFTPEETSKQIDIPNAKSGIYIVAIIGNEIVVTKKVMIK
jgi:hypothetical protein